MCVRACACLGVLHVGEQTCVTHADAIESYIKVNSLLVGHLSLAAIAVFFESIHDDKYLFPYTI